METTTARDDTEAAVSESIRGTRDAISVRRVFGDAYEVEGVTVIPVARVAGGGGGGGGEDNRPGAGGRGFGSGFGLGASPVGVYQVENGNVIWRPSVDVNRIVKGAQVLAGIVAVCATLVLLRRQR